MNNQFSYPVKLIKQKEGGYLIQFLDFAEAITQGSSIKDALIEAADCLEEAIANRIYMKLDIPLSGKLKKGYHLVSVNTIFAAKIALYQTMREQQCSNSALAKKLNCDEKEVRRLTDPHYHSKLPKIEQALYHLGKKLSIEIISCF